MSDLDLAAAIRMDLGRDYQCEPFDGRVRVVTPFLYADDGDNIDVFVEDHGDHFILTDYGETMSRFRMVRNVTKREREVARDICAAHHVGFENGCVVKQVDNLAQITVFVKRVAKAEESISKVATGVYS